MFGNIMTVGSYVFILFILIAVGFVCNKIKLLTLSGVKDMTNFVLYIVTPCVLINSYQREFDKGMLFGLLATIAATILSFAINILLAHIFVRDKDKRREKTLIFGSVFSNCGYMSLPLQSALLGKEGVFYGATYIAIFQVILWTYGIIEMSRDSKNISVKKIIVNPGVIGTLIGLIIFLLSVKIPFVVSEPIGFLASLNTPIPMVIVGFHLANASLKIKGASAYVSMFLRLVVSPLIMLGGLYLFGIRGSVLIACVIAASAPSAAVTAMFSEKFGGDTGLSSAMVSLTTLISIVTMPIVIGLSTMV
ncbi:MAG: AEC family transporter [Monoglobales bacterium]